MPLLLLYGPPLSGKSLAAREVERCCRARGLSVQVLDDASAGFSPALLCSQPQAVHTRLKQQVSQLLSKDRLVVVDFVNCTKSFRYELFCIARERGTRNCVLAPATAFRDGIARADLLHPTRERYGEILRAHALLPRPDARDGREEAAVPPLKRAGAGEGSGWTYERYTDVCSRLEPLLSEQKADGPLFLFSATFGNADAEGPESAGGRDSLTSVCENALDYLYPHFCAGQKRSRAPGNAASATASASIVEGPSRPTGAQSMQGTSAEREEELMRRAASIIADYLP